jgi:hypothetical protein
MGNKDEKWLQSVSIMHADFLPFNDRKSEYPVCGTELLMLISM